MAYVVKKAWVENKEKHSKHLQSVGHGGGFAC